MLLEAKSVSRAFGSFMALSQADVDVTNASPEAHARLGIGRTFQVPATFEEMTIIENVMVGAFLRHANRSDARQKAREVVEFVGLGGQVDQPARSLGTPGRKRLEIARVLAGEPRLILLDEALAGLTPVEIQTAIELVRRIHQRGITLVIVEHIMEVILSLTQRVLVFNQGHTIASGSPRDIVNDPAVIEGDLVGVSDVSLTVAEGQVVALLGSNGAGKTTTLNAIAGLVRPSGGSIKWHGEEIGALPAYAIVPKGLALSPEGWRLFVNQTVEQNLRLGTTSLGDKSRVPL